LPATTHDSVRDRKERFGVDIEVPIRVVHVFSVRPVHLHADVVGVALIRGQTVVVPDLVASVAAGEENAARIQHRILERVDVGWAGGDPILHELHAKNLQRVATDIDRILELLEAEDHVHRGGDEVDVEELDGEGQGDVGVRGNEGAVRVQRDLGRGGIDRELGRDLFERLGCDGKRAQHGVPVLVEELGAPAGKGERLRRAVVVVGTGVPVIHAANTFVRASAHSGSNEDLPRNEILQRKVLDHGRIVSLN